MEKRFIMANDKEIKEGKVTDIYFVRTEEILKAKKLHNVEVNAEITISSVPNGWKWVVYAGLREVLKLLEGLPVDVYSIPEGTIISREDINGIRIPVMNIRGPYAAFAIYETPLLGFLAAATGVATKAARIRKRAGKNTLIVYFGARRNHPAVAPFYDFYAYVGGFNSVSCIAGSEFLGKKPVGTMPHSLLIIFRAIYGDHRLGWKAFHEVMPPEVPRICLADTFWDEVEESIEAVKTLGSNNIWGVRLDTPGSRKGNFASIVREVKWKLSQLGYKNVKVFVSGGIDEHNIKELIEAGADGFGIGSAVASAPPVDFAMDITAVKVNGKWIPITKRGKFSGIKTVWKRIKQSKVEYIVTPEGTNIDDAECIMRKYIENGKIIQKLPSPDDLREYVISQLDYFEL